MIYKKNKYFPYKKGVEINKLLIDEESSTFVTIPDDSDKISKLISIRMEKKFGISQTCARALSDFSTPVPRYLYESAGDVEYPTRTVFIAGVSV